MAPDGGARGRKTTPLGPRAAAGPKPSRAAISCSTDGHAERPRAPSVSARLSASRPKPETTKAAGAADDDVEETVEAAGTEETAAAEESEPRR